MKNTRFRSPGARSATRAASSIAREIAYHGTSLGALSATGITGLRTPFEPLTPGASHVPNTNTYRMTPG
ncbi:MAG: hypothetical protein ACRDLV_06790, partial [Solirubrobacteraceae bacterium]